MKKFIILKDDTILCYTDYKRRIFDICNYNYYHNYYTCYNVNNNNCIFYQEIYIYSLIIFRMNLILED